MSLLSFLLFKIRWVILNPWNFFSIFILFFRWIAFLLLSLALFPNSYQSYRKFWILTSTLRWIRCFSTHLSNLFPLIFQILQIFKLLSLIFIGVYSNTLILVLIARIPWFFSILDALAHTLIWLLLLYLIFIKYYLLLRFIHYVWSLKFFMIDFFGKRFFSLYWTNYWFFFFNNINILKLINSILISVNNIWIHLLLILIFRKHLSVEYILAWWDFLHIPLRLIYLLFTYLNFWSIKWMLFSIVAYRSSFIIFLE